MNIKPIITLDKLLLPSWNLAEILEVPRVKKARPNDTKAITNGLKFESHAINTAVKPSDPHVFALTEWLIAEVNRNPIIPQIVPDSINVLIIIFLVFIPTYLAVLIESPRTTAS